MSLVSLLPAITAVGLADVATYIRVRLVDRTRALAQGLYVDTSAPVVCDTLLALAPGDDLAIELVPTAKLATVPTAPLYYEVAIRPRQGGEWKSWPLVTVPDTDVPLDLLTLFGAAAIEPTEAGISTLVVQRTPAAADATGAAGAICWDANYIYLCVATDTWKRAALTTWGA
jgi:hypothetical protein